MGPIIIQPSEPGYWYAVFYAAAFLVGFLLLVWEGRRVNLPMLPWCLVIATAFLFFIIGTQVIKWGTEEWKQVLQLEKLNSFPGRSVLGGIVFFVPGLLLAKWLLRFRHSVVDTFALVFPVGMIIQRMGCLLVGCCYGKTSALPWSVQYTDYSDVFHYHVSTGLIPSTSNFSLPVHPVQVYDIACCLAMVFIIFWLRRRLIAPGSLLFSSIFLYGFFRFFLEFVRVSQFSWNIILTPVQIAVLIILPLIAWAIYRNETRKSPNFRLHEHTPSDVRIILYSLGLLLVYILVSKWLSALETRCFNLTLLPVLGMVAWHAFRAVTLPRMRGVTLMLIVTSLVLMSQAIPEDVKKKDKRISYWSASYGLMSGTYDLTLESRPGCTGGSTYMSSYKNSFSAQGIGISYTDQRGPEQSMTYGLSGFAGKVSEDRSNTLNYNSNHAKFTNWGISPYLEFNGRKAGFRIGVTAGNVIQFNSRVMPVDSTSLKTLSFAPALSFRYGVLNKGFIEYRLANQFPSPFPTLIHQYSLGIGFGDNGGTVRLGTSSQATFFVEPVIPIGDHLLFQSFFAIGGGLGSFGESKASQYSLALHYKFGRKER